MNILNITPDLDEVFNDPNFLIMLESHLTYLKTNGNVVRYNITEHQNYKFEGDLFGLLDDIHLDKKHHHVVMRVNGYESSADFKGDVSSLLIPDLSELSLLQNIYMTRNI